MIVMGKNKIFYSLVLVTFIEILSMTALNTKVWAQSVSAQISRLGDTTHLEFKGRKDWVYDTARKNENKLSVIVPALDDATVVQLQAWNCPLIKEISVNKNAPDGKHEVIFAFANTEVDSFDYLTDDPSNLIFDFFKKTEVDNNKNKETASVATDSQTTALLAQQNGASGTTNSEKSKVAKKKKKRTALPDKIALGSDDYKLKERAPASDEFLVAGNAKKAVSSKDVERKANILYERGAFDGGDPNYDRFRVKDYEVSEMSIIASQRNIYLKFPMLSQSLKGFEELMKTPPEYEVKPEDTEENKEVRFILTLFNKNRLGALFETLKYFHIKRPNSKYDEIVKNVEAEAHIRLYKRDGDPKDYEAFTSMYEYLIETYPDSVLTDRNQLLLGYASLEKGDGARTIQVMQKYIDKYPKSEHLDRARIALAEAYVLMNKPVDAIRTYEELIESPLDKNYAIEAAYRIGDVHFGQNDYAKAIKVYESARAKYPLHKNIFANASYNIAEGQFWLKEYRTSLDSYIDFIKAHPTHKHGGFAMARIGELLEILGADSNKAMGAFIEGYFRYPDSQGSEVSRIRMLSQALKTMKEREKKYAITEINEITQKSTLPQIQEFATLMKAAGYSRRNEFNESLNLLVDYYQKNPTTANLNVFKGRILRNIADILKEKTNKNDFIDALNFYGKFSNTWLKNSGRIDTAFFQALAFEKSGVIREAETAYRSILANLETIAGKQEEKERMVYELLPSTARVNLRIAACALEQKKYQESYKHIQKISGRLTTEEEIEKIRIGAKVSEHMGDTNKAITFLENLVAKEKDNGEMLVSARLDLVKHYIKNEQFDNANKQLAEVEALKIKMPTFADDDWMQALELRGDLQFNIGQRLGAVETYTKLLEQFESKYPLSSIRYRAGLILFEDGDIKGAQKIWDGLSDKSGLVYKRLALEKLTQAEWSDTYKKYIDRIPAAEKIR